MNVNQIKPGQNVPHDLNVIIEIPADSPPVKYEYDKEVNNIVVDRFLPVAMRYPCNYGFMPQTLSEDGDPIDVLVVTPVPLLPGVIIRSRPIGMLKMTDEKGKDEKILAVPVDEITPHYSNVKDPQDLSPSLTNAIAHFFEHYKDLDANKWSKIEGWTNVEEAHAVITESIRRFEG